MLYDENIELNSLESKETIDKFLEYIKKERHISAVSNLLGKSDFEIIGLVRDLIESGINIIVKQYDDGFHLLNQGDIINKDISTYNFTTSETNEFSFVAISDTRLGSKSQQLAILNDIYRKAQNQGIKNVILCGNISSGLKPMTDTESNFIDDTQAQIDYIVANDVSRSDIGFSSEENEVIIYKRNSNSLFLEKNSKKEIAKKILEFVYASEYSKYNK